MKGPTGYATMGAATDVGAVRRAEQRGVELEGTIGTFSMRELVEMVVYSSVTGVLIVGDADAGGRLFFRDGLPYDAQCNGLTGFDAAALLFNSGGLPFSFHAGATSASETLWMDPWELIDRGEDRARQWAFAQPYIPGMDWVPALREAASSNHVHISEAAWPVLAAVDGVRSVSAIAEHLALSLGDVCYGLATLVDQRLIQMVPPPQIMEPAPAALEDPAPDEGGFFERLIAKTLEEERRRTSEPNMTGISDPDLRPRVLSDEA